jgi:hypothetical protein
MAIMPRSGAKSSIGVWAGEYEVYGFGEGEGGRVAQQVEGGETPVEAVQAKMLGEPVFEFVFSLLGC